MVGAAGRRSADANARATYSASARLRGRGPGSSCSDLDRSPRAADASGCRSARSGGHASTCFLCARRADNCARATRADGHARAWGHIATRRADAASPSADGDTGACCTNPAAARANGYARASRADGHPAAARANRYAGPGPGYAAACRANGYATCCCRDITSSANGHITCCASTDTSPSADDYAIA